MSLRPARWDPRWVGVGHRPAGVNDPLPGRRTGYVHVVTHGFSTSALLRPLGFAGRRSHSRVWSPGTSEGPPFRSATNATRGSADSRCARVRSSPADCGSFRPRRARHGDLRAFQLDCDGGLLRFPIDQQRANHHPGTGSSNSMILSRSV